MSASATSCGDLSGGARQDEAERRCGDRGDPGRHHPGGTGHGHLTISADAIRSVLATSLRPGPRIRMVSVKADATDLTWLAERVTAGTLRPVVAATFPLDAIADAHRATDTGHTPGKNLVIA